MKSQANNYLKFKTGAHRGAGSKPFDEARFLISRTDNPVPNGRIGRVKKLRSGTI